VKAANNDFTPFAICRKLLGMPHNPSGFRRAAALHHIAKSLSVSSLQNIQMGGPQVALAMTASSAELGKPA
jgi:hypothetical protein